MAIAIAELLRPVPCAQPIDGDCAGRSPLRRQLWRLRSPTGWRTHSPSSRLRWKARDVDPKAAATINTYEAFRAVATEHRGLSLPSELLRCTSSRTWHRSSRWGRAGPPPVPRRADYYNFLRAWTASAWVPVHQQRARGRKGVGQPRIVVNGRFPVAAQLADDPEGSLAPGPELPAGMTVADGSVS
jgi:hypothetical protein